MSRIAHDVLAALFLSLEPDSRELVRTLTRHVLRLPLTVEEREDYVAGFILHAVDAQAGSRPPGAAFRDVRDGSSRETFPESSVRMAAADVVRELVHSTPPPAVWPNRRASGEN
jgi:hypothetical protein